eukprot:TRINITY_DN1068_c0_g1_i5.p2 TRINITY_DN1068_c0_g1~~TRINITY_DN1068_c0_g1_i5.p2  ORF type:complete len:145 (-),score=44.47 TRINITY_DN1068_c0_g1_i5:99-533(-)
MPESKEGRELVQFLLQLFKEYGVLSLGIVTQKLALAFRENKFEKLRPENTKVKDIQSTLEQIAGTIHGIWYLKSGGSPEVDQYRNVLISLFKENVSLQKKDVEQAMRNQLGKNIPPALYERLMREFSYSKNNQWILRSGREVKK